MRHARSTKRAAADHARRILAAVAACAMGLIGAVTCGGTTGREGLDASGASPDGASAIAVDDADLDAGAFEVSVQYADREVPDVAAPVDSGADSATPWPSCPPFLPVDPSGQPVPLGGELLQIPAEYGLDGSAVPAPDGSPCATYPWLGSVAADRCVTGIGSVGWGAGDFPLLPPCSWCADASTASEGPGAGKALYALCIDLYECAMRTGCGPAANDAVTCLCGDASSAQCIVSPTGPCATEELAALQYRPDSIEKALTNYYDITPQFAGVCGGSLNYVFQQGIGLGCFQNLDAGAHTPRRGR